MGVAKSSEFIALGISSNYKYLCTWKRRYYNLAEEKLFSCWLTPGQSNPLHNEQVQEDEGWVETDGL